MRLSPLKKPLKAGNLQIAVKGSHYAEVVDQNGNIVAIMVKGQITRTWVACSPKFEETYDIVPYGNAQLALNEVDKYLKDRIAYLRDRWYE